MTDTSTQVFRNYYTFENDLSLTNDASGVRFGRSITQYEIRRRRDVKNLDSIMGYVLMMKQRIIIPSTTNYQPGTRSQSSYKNYPAILSNKVTLKANNGADILLQEMFPRTLNSQVSTSTTVGNSTGTSTTQQNTSGSSDTNVNTFGIGISGGMFGELPFVSLSSEYSHSWQNTKMHSQIQGSSLSENHSSGAASTMSIKDWSSYGYLDNKGINPTWLWGQSYPWDVIQYNQTKNGTTINLPDFVQSRLLSDDLVLPPSQLSLFGLDFIMTAGWIINFPKGMSEDETITILHTTQSFIASHEKDGDSISATLQSSSAANQSQYSSGTLSLSKYALDPIMSAGSDNGAAIGFKANPFTAKTREIVKGMFNKVFPVDLTKTEAEVLSELVDLVSSIRIPTYMSGFATKDRVMQHPANRKLAYFGDPRNTASLHSQMDTKRRQYVQKAMDMAQNREDSSQEIIESGARAAIEFTLNYFTAPVTANNVFQYTQKSATVLSDPPNQRQLAERERLKRIYENLGGKLRPQPWSSSSATETQEESWTRKWGLSHDPLEDSLSVLEAPPSPRRFPRLSPNQLEEYGVNNQKKLQTLGFAE